MSNQSSNLESIKEKARIKSLVEKLRGKLNKFAVMDRQGELMGELNDLILDNNHQLNLVVSQLGSEPSRLFLVISKLIEKIDPPNKSVLVNINKAEIENLPEYVATETLGMQSEISNSLVTPPQEAAEEGTTEDSDRYPLEALEAYSDTPKVSEEEIIRLLGERLLVERTKRKVGEVIVRKEIETRMVQVPVRREKLIIEQVSPERKQLAEIDLGQEELTGIELTEPASLNEVASLDGLTVGGVFNSPKIASLLLNAIALERRHGCKQIRIEIVVENEERQKTYQEWFNRSSGSQQVKRD